MNNTHQVHNLIILDESGSMESIKTATMQGFNEIVQTIKGIEKQFPEQQHFISLVSFNGMGRKTHLWRQPVSLLQQLTAVNYKPDASTPLFDAMGWSLNKLASDLETEENYNVLVNIFTDGEENSSVEFTGKKIRNLVKQLKKNKWTFTYIGTEHDVEKIALSLSITNVLRFDKTEDGLKNAFHNESIARANYSRKIRNNEDTSEGYYSK